MVEESRGGVSRMVEESSLRGIPNGREKLTGFTQPCGNRRFAALWRLAEGVYLRVQPDAVKPLTGR